LTLRGRFDDRDVDDAVRLVLVGLVHGQSVE
jgi:hypothetical protein